MSEEAIRTQVGTILGEVAAVGKVYSYGVVAVTIEDFAKAFLADDGTICGWRISRESSEEKYDDPAESTAKHTFKLTGYKALSVVNGSDAVWQALLNAICGRFRFDHYLSGINDSGATQVTQVSPMQILKSDERLFFDSVLCHYAELAITVEELITS